jgi:hypothetical protein
MISAPELSQDQLDSPLGRTSPVVKLAVAIAWLSRSRSRLEPLPPVAVAVLALGAGMWLGQIPIPDLARALAPLWLAALGIGLFNTLFSPANLDPSAAELITIGPFRITEPALLGGVSLALRVIAIAPVGAVFALTTDSTKLVDSLVQQARIPERFAYGTHGPRTRRSRVSPRTPPPCARHGGSAASGGALASAAAREPPRARDPHTGTARHSPWMREPSARCRARRTRVVVWGPATIWIALRRPVRCLGACSLIGR